MAQETITLRLIAQDLMSGNVSKAVGSLDRLAKQGGLVGAVAQGVGQSFGQMLNPVGLATNAIGTLTDFMGDAISKASDWEEANSKVSVVFGDQARVINDWAKTAGTSLGMTETAALAAAGTLGNLFSALDLSKDATLEMSKGIVQLAADLGSFNNVATDEALIALQAGLVGETEPMRRFGANLSAARVEAYALAKGMATTKAAITEAMKVQARYELILQDTVLAQGDFARTSDGLANSSKIIAAELDNITTEIGRELLPYMKDFANMIRTDVLPVLKELIQHIGGTAQVMDILFKVVNRDAVGATQALDRFFQLGIMGPKEMARELVIPTNAGIKFFDTIETGSKGAAQTFSTSMRTIRVAHRRTAGSVLQSVEEVMDPYKAAWKALAKAAKDPFRPQDFENWIAGRHRAAIRKSQDPDLPAKTRRFWARVANAMSSPIFAELFLVNQSIIETTALISTLRGVGSSIPLIGGLIGAATNGINTGRRRRNLGGINADGTPNRRLTSATLGPSGGGGGSGRAVAVTFNSYTPPTEADIERIARDLGPAIRRAAAA